MLYPILEHIFLNNYNHNVMIVEVRVEDFDTQSLVCNITLPLNVKYMRIDIDGEFEKELYRDIRKALNFYYDNYNILPDIDSLKSMVERSDYCMTE